MATSVTTNGNDHHKPTRMTITTHRKRSPRPTATTITTDGIGESQNRRKRQSQSTCKNDSHDGWKNHNHHPTQKIPTTDGNDNHDRHKKPSPPTGSHTLTNPEPGVFPSCPSAIIRSSGSPSNDPPFCRRSHTLEGMEPSGTGMVMGTAALAGRCLEL